MPELPVQSEVDLSVVTPCLNAVAYLALCHASVADQQGVRWEHVVSDGGSTDETVAWLSRQPDLRWRSGRDRGMYDAVNKGLRDARGGVLGYLNADEQYLPGALRAVREYFARHPDIEIVFGDAVIADASGRVICLRRTLVPRLRHTVACHLYPLTCATFFRRSLVDRGFRFDPEYRNVGDAEWMTRLLRGGVRMGHVDRPLAVFMETGANLGRGEAYETEKRKLAARFPGWWSSCAGLWAAQHRLRRLLAGHYRRRPLTCGLYVPDAPERRTEISVRRAPWLWKERLRG